MATLALHAADTLSGILITAAIGAVIGGVGWIIAYILTGLREDRTKRLQLTIEHTSTQIKEFYAPLTALTDQLNTLVLVKRSVVGDGPEDQALSGLFYAKFFLPIHEEINAILKSKVHLLEGPHPQ
jgi:hypothetical protein